ncbi:hypothetical protein FRC17_005632 [Serendipita sp. 399]|nr:hypothetical protein FRC17_005632 [Serendipita sp. 399]
MLGTYNHPHIATMILKRSVHARSYIKMRPMIKQLSTAPPETTRFSSPARPAPIHPRPLPKKDLPEPKRYRRTGIVVAAVLGFAGWGAFLLYATNLERLSSSVTVHIISQLKNSQALQAVLGTPVKLSPMFGFGDPWISGSINIPAGHVDLSFRIQGPKMGGTVYFTSIRKEKGHHFTILRFKVIADNGETISLMDKNSLEL